MAKNQHTQRRSFILKIQSGVKEMGGQDGQLRTQVLADQSTLPQTEVTKGQIKP